MMSNHHHTDVTDPGGNLVRFKQLFHSLLARGINVLRGRFEAVWSRDRPCDTRRALECAQALAEGGMGLITVHARTKLDGYRPPAHWEWVAHIASVVAVPVVANGEIWTLADWRRCRQVSGADDVMLGRGAVSDPFLVRAIRRGEEIDPRTVWPELARLISELWRRVQPKVAPRHAPGRLKQWLNMLRRRHPGAEGLFHAVRSASCAQQVSERLASAGLAADAAAG